jgi:protein SERAC1
VIANNAEQNQSRILDCTQVIAFLGTPHRGSDLASWATLAANLVNTAKRANRAILDTLNPKSDVLSMLVNDFHPTLKSRERKEEGTVNITCYAEELAVSRWGKSFMVS